MPEGLRVLYYVIFWENAWGELREFKQFKVNKLYFDYWCTYIPTYSSKNDLRGIITE